MKFSRQGTRPVGLLLDMTPMIDIVFLLLIFFLTTAQLARESRAELDLPDERGEQASEVERAGLIVNVLPDGSLQIGDRVVSLQELEAIAIGQVLGSRDEKGRLVRPLVRADRNAPAERLNEVFNALRRAGTGSVRLATSPSRR
ncbi:MAG: biopolymer transporter ExbD [Phycisphaerales bacterium]|jgi:biopolymer transport protein ExbD|nr:biopolymer transporter ExbD [Phycisphaerales bacterium]